MTRTLTERMTVIETKFETVIEPMAFKVSQIHDALPEIVRKVNTHHTVFHEHSDLLNSLKEAQCPAAKVMPEPRKEDGNGGYLERRTKKSWLQQFKDTSLVKRGVFIIAAIPFLGAYWQWIFTKAHDILNWIEALPK